MGRGRSFLEEGSICPEFEEDVNGFRDRWSIVGERNGRCWYTTKTNNHSNYFVGEMGAWSINPEYGWWALMLERVPGNDRLRETWNINLNILESYSFSNQWVSHWSSWQVDTLTGKCFGVVILVAKWGEKGGRETRCKATELAKVKDDEVLNRTVARRE